MSDPGEEAPRLTHQPPVRAAMRSRLGRDFPARLVSAVALAALALGLLYAGSVPFAVLVCLVGGLASWEWSRMVRATGLDVAFLVQAVAVVMAATLSGVGLAALGLVVVVVGAILVGLLTFGRRPLLSAAGVLYIGLPAVAVLWLREDVPHGLIAVLFLLMVVAVTDTLAYLGGRLIGGPRLWPRISPGKTWAGLLTGVAASIAAGAGFSHATDADPVALGLTGALFGFTAQLGDLAESGLKRHFGVKDTSALIPGHGGVLDRIDGLVAVAVVAALVALLINPYAPATGLIYGR